MFAYDLYPPGHGCSPFTRNWVEVVGLDAAEAAARHPDATLFFCWPPAFLDMSERALAAYRGDRIVVAGAPGCFAKQSFYDAVAAGWVKERTIELPDLQGIYNLMWFYRRRT